MDVSSVNQSGPPPEAVANIVKQQPVPPQKTESKQDSVFLSEKAKDLAAQNAGKAFQEEAKESYTAKTREAAQKAPTVS
jgi:hypothetical protein